MKYAEKRFANFFDTIFPNAQAHEQKLKLKLLESKLEPAGFEIQLRNYRSEVENFREENLTLLGEEQKLGTEYDKVTGAQTVDWEGTETTLSQLSPYLQSPDRQILANVPGLPKCSASTQTGMPSMPSG